MPNRPTKILLIVFYLVFVWSANAIAIVGNQWKQFPEVGRQGYLMGVFDSWNTLRGMKDLVNSPPNFSDMVTEIAKCAAGRFSYEQMMAIVEKYMADNPASWHHDMPSLILRALSPPCKAYIK